MWPFSPAWSSKNPHKEAKAVTGTTNQKTLARRARTASSEWVRLETIGKLDNLDVLAEIETQTLSASIALGVFDRIREIVGALQDQSALVALAKDHAYLSVRKEAIRHITDTAVLSAIAKGNDFYNVRVIAAIRLNDTYSIKVSIE